MKDSLNVGLIGLSFMGRAHTNAWIDAPYHFDLPVEPVRKIACDKVGGIAESFAEKYGWDETETDWQKLVLRDDIQVIDICTSNMTHMPIAVAAAKNGKHILCEKPISINAGEARKMLDAALEADVRHMVAFNYRRVPALVLAKQIIDDGKIERYAT